ncbi:hypothetical protein Gotur_010283 [Gossypium turneri]
MISDGKYEANLFCNIKLLRISGYSDESAVFPISFLRRFYNLEGLELGSCNFKELASFESNACEDKDTVITIPNIKNLKLYAIKNIRHFWKQDSSFDHICASLEHLKVWQCGDLINLGIDLSFFENLTTLDVWKCKEMLALITSSKARSLVCLVTMRIRECEMVREVIVSEEDDTSYEIVFSELKRLELLCLQSLTSFCSGSYTFRFPSLEQVTLSQCPRMKNFCQGELTTPKLHKVQLKETDFRGRWAADPNATIEQLNTEDPSLYPPAAKLIRPPQSSISTKRARSDATFPRSTAYGVGDMVHTDVCVRARTEARVSGATCVGSGSERTVAGHTRKAWLRRINLLGFSVSDFRFGLRYDWAMGIGLRLIGFSYWAVLIPGL